MSDFNAADFFKCFSDRTRLDIIKLLGDGESYVELIASKLGLTGATVCFHLKKLEAAGIVVTRREQFYIMYKLIDDALTPTLAEIIDREEVKGDGKNEKDERDAAYEREVLASFIKYGRLTALPVQNKKREIVLCHISQRFERGRDYPEKEINAEILKLHDDYCTIRRELVGFGFFTRDHEVYRRVK